MTSTQQITSNLTAEAVPTADLKLEAVIIPVSDVDRSRTSSRRASSWSAWEPR